MIYALAVGFSYAAFTAIVLITIGNSAAATGYNIFASLSNVNEQLYRLLSYIKLNDKELKYARDLLKQGAEPNFTPKVNGQTLVQRACFNHDLNFLNLLIEYGGDVDHCSVDAHLFKYLQKNNPEKLQNPKLFNLRNGRLPIQEAIDDLKRQYFNEEYHELCTILYRVSVLAQTEYKRVEDLSRIFYEEMHVAIQKEWDRAQNDNKRLMILIGETHEAINPVLIESIIVNIVSNLTNHITLLTEHDDRIHAHLEQSGSIISHGNTWLACISLHHLVKNKFNGTIIPIDQGHFGPAQGTKSGFFKEPFDSKSEQGIKYRNEIMSTVACARSKGNVIAVVGAHHLHGLIKETNLLNEFNIVTINATGIAKGDKQFCEDQYIKQCFEFTLSDAVIQACIIRSNTKSALTPDQVIQIGLNCSLTTSQASKLNME